MAMGRAGGQHHRAAAVFAAVAADDKALAVTGKVRDLVIDDLHAQGLHLLGKLLGEIRAGHGRHGGIVLHQRGIDDLAAGILPLGHGHGLTGAGGIQRRRQSGRAAAHHDDIMHRGCLLMLLGN